MKLRELAGMIVKPHGLWTQPEAARRTGIPQWKLSNFKRSTDESDYEKSWQDFLRLLKFCREHNIDPTSDNVELSQLKNKSKILKLKRNLDGGQGKDIMSTGAFFPILLH